MTQSSLLLLPAEIRMKAYQCLFQDATVYLSVRTATGGLPLEPIRPLTMRTYDLGILLACRQISAEAQPVLGSSLHLDFNCDSFPTDLSTASRYTYLSHIQSLAKMWREEPFDFSMFPALRYLKVDADIDLLHEFGVEVTSSEEYERFKDGEHDVSLVERARKEHLQGPHCWMAEAIMDPNRTSSIVDTFYAYARSSDGRLRNQNIWPGFQFEYNIDTFELISKSRSRTISVYAW